MDKLKELWQYLYSNGYTTLEYDKFVDAFSDEGNRIKLYDTLVSLELMSPGNYEKFSALWPSKKKVSGDGSGDIFSPADAPDAATSFEPALKDVAAKPRADVIKSADVIAMRKGEVLASDQRYEYSWSAGSRPEPLLFPTMTTQSEKPGAKTKTEEDIINEGLAQHPYRKDYDEAIKDLSQPPKWKTLPVDRNVRLTEGDVPDGQYTAHQVEMKWAAYTEEDNKLRRAAEYVRDVLENDKFLSVEDRERYRKLLEHINIKRANNDSFVKELMSSPSFEQYRKYYVEQKRREEAAAIVSKYQKGYIPSKIVFSSLAKLVSGVGSLVDIGIRALPADPLFGIPLKMAQGSEPYKKAAGYILGLAKDVEHVMPTPTDLQRGGITRTGIWEGMEVDFDKDGNPISFWKDGKRVDMQIDDAIKEELSKIPKKTQVNYAPFAYQAGVVISDALAQIYGTKGLGALGNKVLGATAARGIGFTAVTAGMVAPDMYNNALLDTQDETTAARVALGSAIGVAIVNMSVGVGIEARAAGFGNRYLNKAVSLSDAPTVTEKIAKGILSYSASGLGEAVEEAVLEKLPEAAIKAIYNANGYNIDMPLNDRIEVLNEAAMGFIAGSVLHSIATGVLNPVHISSYVEAAEDSEKIWEQIERYADEVGIDIKGKKDEFYKNINEVKKARHKLPGEFKNDPIAIEKQMRLDAAKDNIGKAAATDGASDAAMAELEEAERELVEYLRSARGKAESGSGVTVEVEPGARPGVEAEEVPVSDVMGEVPPEPEEVAEEVESFPTLEPEQTEGEVTAEDIAALGGEVAAEEDISPEEFPEYEPLMRRMFTTPVVEVEKEEVEANEDGIITDPVDASRLKRVKYKGITIDLSVHKAYDKDGNVLPQRKYRDALRELYDKNPNLLDTGADIDERTFYAQQSGDMRGYVNGVIETNNPILIAEAYNEVSRTEAAGSISKMDYIGEWLNKVILAPNIVTTAMSTRTKSGRDAFLRFTGQRGFRKRFWHGKRSPSAYHGYYGDAELLAEAISEDAVEDGVGPVTADDIYEFIATHSNGGKFYKPKSNKRILLNELSTAFQKLTGLRLTDKYAESVSKKYSEASRRRAADKERVSESRSAAAGDTGRFNPPPRRGTRIADRVARFINRVVNDERIPEKIREGVKGDLLYEVVSMEDMNRVADETIDELLSIMPSMIDGLKAAVEEAKQTIQDVLRSPSNDSRLQMAAAMAVLYKSAAIMYQNGYIDDATEVYRYVGLASGNMGNAIATLRGDASPESVLGNIMGKVVVDQEAALRKTGTSGKELKEYIDKLHEEIQSIREEMKAAAKEIANEVKIPKKKKEQLKAENKKLIDDIKRLWDEMNGLGFAWDPRRASDRHLELLQKVVKLIINTAQLAAISLEEAAERVKNDLAGKIPDSDKWVEDALKHINDNKVGIDEQDTIGMAIREHYERDSNLQLKHRLMRYGIPADIAESVQSQVEAKMNARFGRKVTSAVNKMLEDAVKDNFVPLRDATLIRQIARAVMAGHTSHQAIQNALGALFGYKHVTPEQAADIHSLAEIIYTSFSRELRARADKELKMLLLKIQRQNEGLKSVLFTEIMSAVVMGVLSNLGTWASVVYGTITKLIPDMLAVSVANPLAAMSAIRHVIRNADVIAKASLGSIVDAVANNFSMLDNEQTEAFGKYTSNVALVEDIVINGIGRAIGRLREGDIKAVGELLTAIALQPYRIAFLLKGIDAMFSYTSLEFIRYIQAFNDHAEHVGMPPLADRFMNAVGGTKSEFFKELDKLGGFDKVVWDEARRQADEEVKRMKAAGEKVPYGFKARRVREIVLDKVSEDLNAKAKRFVDDSLLKGSPSGLPGAFQRILYKATSVDPGKPSVLNIFPVTARLVFGLFMTPAMNSVNAVYKTAPFVSNIMLSIESLVWRYTAGTPFVKYVGKEEANRYPKHMQLGNGLVKKTPLEVHRDVILSAGSSLVAIGLIHEMFMFLSDDDDDKDKELGLMELLEKQLNGGKYHMELRPDRRIDISLTLNDKIGVYQIGGMTRSSFRLRPDENSEWSSPIKYQYILPFAGTMALVGGWRDDLMFRSEEARARSTVSKFSNSIADIYAIIGEMSFNNIARVSKQLYFASSKDPEDPTGSAVATIIDVTSKPYKALIPLTYRDIIFNEILEGTPQKFSMTPWEDIAKDFILTDWWVKRDRFDVYGNPIYRESRIKAAIERASINFIDFKLANEATLEQPEWKLLTKWPDVVPPAMYRPPRSMRKANGEKLTDDERYKIMYDYAKINGKIMRAVAPELMNIDDKVLIQEFVNYTHRYAVRYSKYLNGVETSIPVFDLSIPINASIRKKLDDILRID